MPPSEAEHVYYAQGGVVVTNARLSVGAQTFAMANVTSARLEADKDWAGILFSWLWSPAATAAAVIGYSAGSLAAAVGLAAAAALAAGLVVRANGRLALVVVTAAGEAVALTQMRPADASRAMSAVNDAIASRG